MIYDFVDDPMCDAEGVDTYENCEECPNFDICMEIKEDDAD